MIQEPKLLIDEFIIKHDGECSPSICNHLLFSSIVCSLFFMADQAESAERELNTEANVNTILSELGSNSKYPAILDGNFFRVISESAVISKRDEGINVTVVNIKAVCESCTKDKRSISGTLAATTNFLTHLKVQ